MQVKKLLLKLTPFDMFPKDHFTRYCIGLWSSHASQSLNQAR